MGVYVIAEAGVNHNGSLDLAIKLCNEAKNAGADAVKFQTYKAEKIASKNSPAYWDLDEEPTTSQFELFKKFDTFGPEEYRELAEYCREIGIIFLSTPFDFEAIDFLDDLMDVYKISSSDLTNIPFIKAIALKNKPIILSTGASTLKEIKEAVNAIEEVSNVDIGLMHCVLSYPTKDEDANLLMIKDIKEQFEGYDIGYSDHTKPDDKMLILTTAYLYGANIIEKHFTLDKTLTGNDHYHAMDVEDVKTFNENIELINKIKGKKVKQPLVCESLSRKEARRSIVASKDIKKGEEITRDNITFKRPGTGISPSKVDEIIGMNANEDITEDTLLTYEMLE